MCQITAAFRFINAFADWMSVAMIAVSRCVNLTKPELGQKLFSGSCGKMFIALIWIYACLLVVPIFISSLELGSFGYNCRMGKCDLIPNHQGNITYQIYVFGLGFCIPSIMTILSYIVICWYVGSKNKYLKKAGHANIKKIISKREIRTNWTLFMIWFCYFLCVMPMTLINMIDDSYNYPNAHLALFCLYWLQYSSLNFVVYAARSEQYRKACCYFLRKVSPNVCYTIRQILPKLSWNN